MQEDQGGAGSPGSLYDRIEAVLCARHATVTCDTVGPRSGSSRVAGLVELKEGLFLDTGARVYYDTGHMEWACPESDSAVDATIWDLAADRELEEAARQISESAPSADQAGRVMVIKNNVDYTTHTTYGCHENYSVDRRLPQEALVAFLVTRTILCGAGRWGAQAERIDDPVAFQISQRADFIEQVVSRDTRDGRAILNTRDEPLADARIYRRLHLILGDSNLSSWSNLMKLGTTGLVLDALERGYVHNPPVLRMPVKALRELSRDLECKRSYQLEDGTLATAVEIQRRYWQASSDALADNSDDARLKILQLWDQALEDFAVEPARLEDRADWRVKHAFFEREILPRLNTSWDEIGVWSPIVTRTASTVAPPPAEDAGQWLESRIPGAEFAAIRDAMRENHLDWCDYARQRKNYYVLRALDVRFHDIDRRHGLFYRQPTEDSLPGITADAIEKARGEPPRRTRAWLRGRILRSDHRRSLASLDWDRINLIDGRTISLPDPFATREPEVERLFKLSPR